MQLQGMRLVDWILMYDRASRSPSTIGRIAPPHHNFHTIASSVGTAFLCTSLFETTKQPR
jgi:hypothetical protein